jgi:hypothetical protein
MAAQADAQAILLIAISLMTRKPSETTITRHVPLT